MAATLGEFIQKYCSPPELTDEWADSAKDTNYSEYDEVQQLLSFEMLDDESSLEVFKKLNNAIMTSVFPADFNTWKDMVENGTSPSRLCCLIWLFIERGLTKNSSERAVKTAASACCSYLRLSSLKGAQAYSVFNQYLYSKCLDLFRVIYRLYFFDCAFAKPSKKGKGKGKAKARKAEMEVTGGGDEDEEPVRDFDKSELREMMEEATEAIYEALDKVALSAYDKCPRDTAELLRDLSRVDVCRDTRVQRIDDRAKFVGISRISDRVFALMHKLVESRHSPGGLVVFSNMVYPRLSFWNFDCELMQSIDGTTILWKDLMMEFVRQRMASGDPEEVDVIAKCVLNMMGRCPDRMEYRSNTARCVADLLKILPTNICHELLQFLYNLSLQNKTAHRTMSVELIPIILTEFDLTKYSADGEADEAEPVNTTKAADTTKRRKKRNEEDSEEEDDEEEREREKRKKKEKKKKPTSFPIVPLLPSFYSLVVRACTDKVSTVRGRGILKMGELLADPVHRMHIIDQAKALLLENPRMFVWKEAAVVGEDEDGAEEAEPIPDDEESTIDIPNIIMHIINARIEDEMAAVRKNAVLTVEKCFPIFDGSEAEEAVKMLLRRCVDANVSVRVQAARCVSSLLLKTTTYRDILEGAWLDGVLPMVNDRQKSAQDVASDYAQEIVLNPLMSNNTPLECWNVLSKIEQRDNYRRLFLRALFYIKTMDESRKVDRLKKGFVSVLYKKLLNASESVACMVWMLLSDLTVVLKNDGPMDPTVALSTWNGFDEGTSGNIVRYVAKVLGECAPHIKEYDKEELIKNIKGRLIDLKVDAPHIPTVYLALARLLDAVGENASGMKELDAIGRKILTDCSVMMEDNIRHMYEYHSTSKDEESRLIRMVCSIGEVIQFSPSLIDYASELLKALKTIMASDVVQSHMVINSAIQTPVPSAQPPDSQPSTQSSTQPTSQGTRHSTPHVNVLPQQIVDAIREGRLQLFSNVIRAYAVVAIGKFCLMDEAEAKRCVPVFVKQLKVNKDHVIRNNIVLVICDLCIRYTLLVDRYSPIIASCLKDTSLLVRYQALESLTNLIKEQFIRWEGQIMYRFVSAILDEDASMREYARFCMVDVLLPQMPTMFFSHFVECILYFNNIPRKYILGDDQEIEDGSIKYSLSGPEYSQDRMTLYEFMLSTFDDRKKFETMSRICKEIFSSVASEQLDFGKQNTILLLKDAFKIISCDAIRLHMTIGKKAEDEEEETDEPPQAIQDFAKDKITQIFRKGICECIMPHILDIRAFLIQHKSPMLKECMFALREICRQHQEQIDEFLAGDKILKAELMYDIKRMEEKEKAEKKAAKEAAEAERIRRKSIRKSMMPPVPPPLDGNPPDAPAEGMDVQEGPQTGEERTREHEENAPEVMEEDATQSGEEEEKTREKTRRSTNIVKEEPLSQPASSVGSNYEQPEEDKGMENEDQEERHSPSPVQNAPSATQGTDASAQKERRRSSRRLSARRSKENEAMKEVKEEVEEEERDENRRSAHFAAPKGTGKRKRGDSVLPLLQSIPDGLDETMMGAGRAISTPNKTLANISFAGLTLSAIAPSRKGAVSRRPDENAIEEDD